MSLYDKPIKDIVRKKYDDIAQQSKSQNASSCCGSGPAACCEETDYSMFNDDYSHIQGYTSDADLGLGCGIPTEFAAIKQGDTVLDLGSGAGNDCFVARSVTGESGQVYGIDFSEKMLAKAQENLRKAGFNNIAFMQGDIEAMPFDDNMMDVIISNCVLNLVPDKAKAFAEIYRTLKPGGHFCVSDVVLQGDLPDTLQADAEMYAGCVSGALQKEDYLNVIDEAGFQKITIHKQKEIIIPDSILLKYMKPLEVAGYKADNKGIFSITVSGIK